MQRFVDTLVPGESSIGNHYGFAKVPANFGMKGHRSNMEKRAFTRRQVQLEGICSAPGKGSRQVEIRDFCAGGMLLSYGGPVAGGFNPVHGDVIDIRCAVLTNGHETPLEFQGRVVRIDDNGAGLAFINPRPEALHLLSNYGKQPQQSDTRFTSGSSTLPDGKTSLQIEASKARSLLLACKKLTLSRLDSLVTSFLQVIPERLFQQSGTVQSMPEKTAYFDAINIFNKKGEEFRQTFNSQVSMLLGSVQQGDQTRPTGGKPSASETTLSLVEEDVFTEWLALSDLARRVEIECQEALTDLNYRMGALFGVALDKANNPYAPATISNAFQQSLKGLSLNHSALQVTYASFRDLLISVLRGLYDELNRYLVENDVLPDLRHKYKIPPVKSSGRVPGGLGGTRARGGLAGQHMAAEGASSPLVVEQHNVAPTPADWYNLVQNLDALQKQAARQSMGTPEFSGKSLGAVSSTPARGVAAEEFYTPDELLRGLSQLNFSGRNLALSDDSSGNIKSQLLAVLSHETNAAEDKQLPYREEKIIDVTQNLFHSMLNDKLVSNNVRPWLQQLTGPLFKTALRDDAVFSDKTHLVRQVINNIAQLEFYGEGDQNQNAITKRVNELLAQVSSAQADSRDIFEEALRELNLFIRIQERAYQENLKEVVEEAEELQQRGTIANAPGSATSLPFDSGTAVSAISEDTAGELREWKKRVLRMRVGAALMLNVNSEPRRLKLAWIAKQHDRYVFVNVKGLKELVLSPDQIAHQLHNGTAAVLDDDDEPLLDRAQYSMLQKMHHELLHETTHDHLTGLINRREFEHRLNAALATARQDNLQHSICYIDLDQFSIVNNTFGYDGGDRLLIELAQILAAEMGTHGVLARIGGDEFGILFENCTQDQALAILNRQKTAIQDYRFMSDKKSLSVSFSAGLVDIGRGSDSVIALLQAAESSCRIARGKGTNYIQVFNPADSELMHQTQIIKWVTRIDEALDQNTLELRYQTVAAIGGDTLVSHHAEVLLSVVDEDGRLISPAEFVLAAEHFRRMAAVDKWVIERVFHWMVSHANELADIGGLAINLSGSSLNEEGFAAYIMTLAEEMQVPMQQVCFEITETAGIANLSSASDFILSVKKSGCMFALDDFGSGLSSYAYLKNLPVDFLKIDGAFVKNMDENPYDYAVVKSITEIGHFMGKKIIAEYVEKDSVLAMLREIGVDYGQGYAIAKPLALLG